MRLLFLCILLVIYCSVAGQHEPYRHVDSIMRNYATKIKTADELYKLTYFIRTNFDADSLRLRAAFIWITENIAYDIKAFQKGDPAAAQINYAIKNKMAICAGYANLLKYFCDAFSIENEIVEGFARAARKEIVMNRQYVRPNHAWNAIRLNGSWRLADPTWAAGSVDDSDEENLLYHKGFSELYYFTDPSRFALNHFPVKKQFQLTNSLVDKKKFMRSPLYITHYLADSISCLSPDSSLIRLKKGDSLVFKFTGGPDIRRMFVFSEKLKTQFYETDIKHKAGWFEFCFPIDFTGNHDLFVGYINERHRRITLLACRVEVQ